MMKLSDTLWNIADSMKHFNSTLDHSQHKKQGNKMEKYQNPVDAMNEKHKLEREELEGLTTKVKDLKALVGVAGERTNGLRDYALSQDFAYNPKEARLREVLGDVRKELTGTPSEFFGVLDHGVVRTQYEYSALNDRQKKTVLKNYPWMVEELTVGSETPPQMEKDKWESPLQNKFDALSKEEKAHFSAIERSTILDYTELAGAEKQPTYIGYDGTGVQHRNSILKED